MAFAPVAWRSRFYQNYIKPSPVLLSLLARDFELHGDTPQRAHGIGSQVWVAYSGAEIAKTPSTTPISLDRQLMLLDEADQLTF